MPTISGLRRRGYTPASVRSFCERVGVTKSDNVIELELLENSVRQDLERRAPRALAVLRPLRVVIENYPADRVEELDAANHPNDAEMGTRKIPFSRVVYIERDDFMENPSGKFFRLAPGREVRLRYAYFIKCVDVVKNEAGEVVELRCTYDPGTRGGNAPDGRKVKGTLHWVSAEHALAAEVRLYDRLFTVANPMAEKSRDFTAALNPDSLEMLTECRVEPALGGAAPGQRFQLERLGYFCVDTRGHGHRPLVLNRTVTLRDTWAKLRSKP